MLAESRFQVEKLIIKNLRISEVFVAVGFFCLVAFLRSKELC